ncbi:MAG TPA: hypothetical protein VK250_06850, partial [Nitrososphaeraceae archaeon]|nr:hypothetical protein [Nitrososphaeraceae archaeon]
SRSACSYAGRSDGSSPRNNAGESDLFPQMLVSGNNVYIAWNDESNGGDRDVFFRASNNNGLTFNPVIDLSNNNGFSFLQQMLASANNVYVIWTDNSNGGDDDLFFRVSNNNGLTFNPVIDLSDNDGDTGGSQMLVSGDNVYVVWVDREVNLGDYSVLFRISNNNGLTFNPVVILTSNSQIELDFQEMIVLGNNVYVLWQDEEGLHQAGDSEIYFTVSNNNGLTFNPVTNLSDNDGISTRADMIISGKNVYVVWEDESNGGDRDVFFRASNNNGQTFNPFIDLSSNNGESRIPIMLVG